MIMWDCIVLLSSVHLCWLHSPMGLCSEVSCESPLKSNHGKPHCFVGSGIPSTYKQLHMVRSGKGHPLFSIGKFSTGHLWEDLTRHSSWSMGKQPPQFMGIFTEHFPPKGEICQILPGGLLSRSSWNYHQRVWQLFLGKMNVLWRVKLNFVKDTWEFRKHVMSDWPLCLAFYFSG